MFKKGKWRHRAFRDVYFYVTSIRSQTKNYAYLAGWWIRRDMGCGELVLKDDKIGVRSPSPDDWQYLGA